MRKTLCLIIQPSTDSFLEVEGNSSALCDNIKKIIQSFTINNNNKY